MTRFRLPTDLAARVMSRKLGAVVLAGATAAGVGLVAASPASAAPATPDYSSVFHAVTPQRLADTRSNPAASRAVQHLALTNFGIPCSTTGDSAAVFDTAVQLTVSVVDPSGSGYLGLNNDPSRRGFINYSKHESISGTHIFNIGASCATQSVDIRSYGPSVQLVVDLVGYYTGTNSGATPQPTTAYAGGHYHDTTPTRLVDTRRGLGGTSIGAHQTLTFPLTTLGASTAGGVSAVVANVTAVKPSVSTFLIAYKGGTTQPHVASMNTPAGRNSTVRLTIPADAGGTVSIYNASGTTGLVVDLVGYFDSTNSAGGGYLQPNAVQAATSRLVDSRSPNSTWRTGTNSVNTFQIPSGVCAGASDVILNVISPQPGATGYITLYPSNLQRPATSDVSTKTNIGVANLAYVHLNADRSIITFSSTSGPLVIDLVGCYKAAAV